MNSFDIKKILKIYNANIHIKAVDFEKEFKGLSSFMHRIIDKIL